MLRRYITGAEGAQGKGLNPAFLEEVGTFLEEQHLSGDQKDSGVTR